MKVDKNKGARQPDLRQIRLNVTRKWEIPLKVKRDFVTEKT